MVIGIKSGIPINKIGHKSLPPLNVIGNKRYDGSSVSHMHNDIINPNEIIQKITSGLEKRHSNI